MTEDRPDLEAIAQDEYATTFVTTVLRLSGVHGPAALPQMMAAAARYEAFREGAAAARNAGLAIDWVETEPPKVRAILQAFLFVCYGLIGRPTHAQLQAAVYWYRALKNHDESPLTE
ncbi:MAG: hypothetical protein ABIQ86_07320 [Steroidobacteraceae bacterium]